ncbi:MAG: YbaK/EbsC family protein [Betaproteobacteria bacterium]|nr:MAG: YbaK/EbsC family protein [Betaproteobacteria bacterium]
MKPARHPTALRTSQLLREAGIDTHVVEFEQPTRTSVEAAAAIGCSVAEIAKSIVFRGQDSGQAVVVIASGDNRVSEAKVAAELGEPLTRADADFVRTTTGYAIGGVAPIGHSQPVKLLLDEDLRRFETVWAAAGTPFSVFPVRPDQLRALTGTSDNKLRTVSRRALGVRERRHQPKIDTRLLKARPVARSAQARENRCR